MAIHWQVKFKSLKSGVVYTASIYDSNYSGSTRIQLKGGAQPFVTQEDDSDDMFTPIRTQSGYLRIVDDGKDADGNAFNWRTFIPTTDTDRPVILSHEENGSTVIDWMGFMQAQNFGAQLYGNPREREFPLQCPLTILSCFDIRISESEDKQIHNFAYLLHAIIDKIPAQCSPNNIMIQGNTDAQTWLLKRIDWQNFVSEDAEGNAEPGYDMYQCLENMCRFWGWTARMKGDMLYLLCIDDLSEQKFLQLSITSQNDELATMAGGVAAGTTNIIFASTTIGNIFASADNTDTQMRGPNKVSVSATSDEYVKMIEMPPITLLKAMQEKIKQGQTYTESYGDGTVMFSNDIYSFDAVKISGGVGSSAFSPYDSYNLMKSMLNDGDDYSNTEWKPVIRVKKSYSTTYQDAKIKLQTKYEHTFSGGEIRIKGKTYQRGEEYIDLYHGSSRSGWDMGSKTMYVSLGIGPSENDASTRWYNGGSWSTTKEKFMMTLGNEGDTFYVKIQRSAQGHNFSKSIDVGTGRHGKLFFIIYGSPDMPGITDPNNPMHGQCPFDLVDFAIEYYTQQTIYDRYGFNNEFNDFGKKDYKATNNANVHTEENIDAPFVSLNDMNFGTNILANPDDTFMEKIDYHGAQTVNEYPEQHLANRIASYWSQSRRKIDCYVLAHDGTAATNANSITPRYRVSIDGTVMAPISISRNWRDDIISLSLMELFPDD